MITLSNYPFLKNMKANRFFLLAGPCVIEDEESPFKIAEQLVKITKSLDIPFVFKGSYRKANRSRLDSFHGIGDERALNVLKNSTDRRVRILWVADKLSNMRAFCRQYKRVGDELWNSFNMKDKKLQHWYYSEVVRATEELKDFHAWQELKELTEFVFNNTERKDLSSEG